MALADKAQVLWYPHSYLVGFLLRRALHLLHGIESKEHPAPPESAPC